MLFFRVQLDVIAVCVCVLVLGAELCSIKVLCMYCVFPGVSFQSPVLKSVLRVLFPGVSFSVNFSMWPCGGTIIELELCGMNQTHSVDAIIRARKMSFVVGRDTYMDGTTRFSTHARHR